MTTAFDHAQALYDAAEPNWTEEEEGMDTHGFADGLAALLNEAGQFTDEDWANLGLSREMLEFENVEAVSYEAAGVLTRDAGFVVHLPDGSEFQVTVVRSR